MSVNRRKTFSYKKASFSTPVTGQTLQSLLNSALKKRELINERRYNPTADGKTFSFINYNLRHGSANAGGEINGVEFLGYVHGASKSTFEDNPTAKTLPLKALKPNSATEDFVDGTLYAGVFNQCRFELWSLKSI